jgi:hypothetical protein
VDTALAMIFLGGDRVFVVLLVLMIEESRLWFFVRVGTKPSAPSRSCDMNRDERTDSSSSRWNSGVDRYRTVSAREPRGCGTLEKACVWVAKGVLRDGDGGISNASTLELSLVGRTRSCTPRMLFLPTRLFRRLQSFHTGSTRSRLYRLRNREIPCLYIVGKATSTSSGSTL